MKQWIVCLLVGGSAGALSGMFGIGGGILVVPALVALLGYTQHQAQGTSLAMMLIPIGVFLSVRGYWNESRENIQILSAALLAAGFLAGSLLGSGFSLSLDPRIVQKGFAVFLVAVAAYMWIKAGA